MSLFFQHTVKSSLPVVVAQSEEKRKQNSFCVGVVWQTQSIVQHMVQTN